jgi:hypothetical protein
MSKQVLDSIQFDDTGDGGSVTETYQASIQTEGEISDETDTVQVLSGIDRRRGYRRQFSARVLKPGAHTALAPLMKNRNETAITLNWRSGDTTVLTGTKVTVLPVVSVVPDNVSVWYDTDTSATDTPETDSDSSWTELAEPLGGLDPSFDVQTRTDGSNLPFYIYGILEHNIQMFYDSTALSNLRTEYQNNNEVRIAFELQSGEYLIYGDQTGGGVVVDEPQTMPAMSPDEVLHMMVPVKQTGDLDDIVTFPTGAEDLFYGVEITAETFGHDEGDVLTENR